MYSSFSVSKAFLWQLCHLIFTENLSFTVGRVSPGISVLQGGKRGWKRLGVLHRWLVGQVHCPHCLAQGKCGNVMYLVQSSDSKLSTLGGGGELGARSCCFQGLVRSWGQLCVVVMGWVGVNLFSGRERVGGSGFLLRKIVHHCAGDGIEP